MKKIITGALLLFALGASAQRQSPFDNGWMFSLENGPAKSVNLPHDWSIGLQTSNDAPMAVAGGYFPAGKGEYVKTFKADANWQNKNVSLLFEGVYMDATITLNGKQLAQHVYGWTPFEVNISDALNYQGENTLKVDVDNSHQINARWYTGSGIYRHVWLKCLPKTDAIGYYAVHTTKQAGGDYRLDVEVLNKNLDATVKDKSGAVVAHGKLPLTMKAPTEWCPENPALYTLTLKSSTDEVSTKIGFRTITFSAEKGLILNGRNIVLNGACAHSDNGALGAAAYDDAEIHRVKLLKDAGFNAVRTSHNPASTAFLNACDSLGLLVISEIFDGWRTQKNNYDYHTVFDRDWQMDVDSWVKRDVNHPSVFCWSIGNEVIERTDPECVMTARKLVGRVHSIDPYRPVTSAMCSWGQGWARFDTLMAEHNICGYNYYIHEAESDHKRVPSRVIIQTESYPRDAVSNYHKTADNPYIIGDFVWTGLDYLGESGLGRYYYEGETKGESWQAPQYPTHGAYCGDVDIIGWRKPISHLRSLLWNKDNDELYMAVKEPDGYYGKIKTTEWSVWPTWERWTWNGWEDKPINVEVYTHAPSVKLYLNGKLIGEKKTEDCIASFQLNYAPGTLKAVASGKNTILRTAGKPAKIKLDRESGRELQFITATLVDKNGTPVPDALDITFTADNAEILSTATANLKDTVAYSATTRRLWNSRAQAVLRAKSGAVLNVNVGKIKASMKLR